MLILLARYLNAVSQDCPSIIALATSLNIGSNLLRSLKPDCCANTIVICESSRVTELRWDGLGLKGSINSSLIPSTLKALSVSGNSLNGSLFSFSSIQWINFNLNQINGTLPIIPSTLTFLSGVGNLLTGPLPQLSENMVSVYLYLQSNFLSGGLPEFPLSLSVINVASNRMIGDVPLIPNTSRFDLYLNNNHFSGTVNIGLPFDLKLDNNYITDVIVGNPSFLSESVCDFSNNPLIGNPRAILLASAPYNCVANDLYAASSFPMTKSSSISTLSTMSKSAFLYISKTSSPLIRISSESTNIDIQLRIQSNKHLPFTEIENNKTTIATQDTIPTDIPQQLFGIALSDPIVLYILIGSFMGVCVLLLILSKYVKNPTIASKFGRKNSFACLNTLITLNQRTEKSLPK